MRLVRQGECNRCGQCCGADGKMMPWPAQLLDGLLRWKLEDVRVRLPHLELLDVGQATDGRMVVQNQYGQIRIRGDRYDWVWDDSGLHKPDSMECPLLRDDPGDGTRPCGLIGTNRQNIFDAICAEGLDNHGYPMHVYEDDEQRTAYEKLNDWMEEYPDCSFTYVEEI